MDIKSRSTLGVQPVWLLLSSHICIMVSFLHLW